MKKKTLVFTDLDGTLLDHYTYQTEDAEETISTLKFHDIAIIPNSSKTLSEILLIRQQLNLQTPFIIENGAAVYIPIDYFPMQPADTRLSNGFWIKSFCEPTTHWLSLLNEQLPHFKAAYKGFSEMDASEVAALTGLTLMNAEMAKQRQYGEPLNWFGSELLKAEFIEMLYQLGANPLEGGRFLHVSGHCDKGQAQQWLAEQYKSNTEHSKQHNSQQSTQHNPQHSTQHNPQHSTQHNSQHSTQHNPQHSTQHNPQHSTQHNPQHSTQHNSQHSTQHNSQHSTQHNPQHSTQHNSQPSTQHNPQHNEVITIALGDGQNDIAMLEQATIAIQVRSPVHDFPCLNRTDNIYQSKQYGPAGWAEGLYEMLLSKLMQ